MSAAAHQAIIGSVPTVRLFVYGSLKRGGRHHSELAGARFLGDATTAPGYSLVQLGTYLALVPGGAGTVVGEVFELESARLSALDAFEGPEYERVSLEVLLGATSTKALAYAKRSR
jgi:gamma-glutamylcyclotransferase (GGCT)/AIG2-like uncharacterized protein YtfP